MPFIQAVWLQQAMALTGLEFLARSATDPALYSALDQLFQATDHLAARLPQVLAGVARESIAREEIAAAPELAPACGMTPGDYRAA